MSNKQKQIYRISRIMADLEISNNTALKSIDRNKALQKELERELQRLESMLTAPVLPEIGKNKN